MAQSPISAKRVIITSFLVDLTDVAFNAVVAILSGSVVMLAETLQGGADLLTSGLLLIGLHRARRPSSRYYRFGHGRELFFWVLMAGVSLFVLTGTLSLYFGINRLLHPEPISHLGLAFAALIIGLATNTYAFTLSLRRLRGTHTGPRFWHRLRHSSLVETKATLILDVLGALASIFALLALATYGLTGNSQFDGLGSVLIGITTAILALALIMSVKDLLVGRSATSEIEDRIRAAALDIKGVKKVLDLRTMYLGSEQLLVNIEVHMEGGLETQQIERLIDQIKHHITVRVPLVSHIQVELETPDIISP
jgi:cation diffusion facilitator family transporter